LSILLWIAGVFIALRLMAFVVTAHTYARLRLLPHAFSPSEAGAIPESVLPLFERAARELEALGFETQSFALLSPVLEGDSAAAPHLLLRHRDRRSWAAVYPAGAPNRGALLDLLLVSHFADETSLVTLSGQKASLPCDVPGQRVIDNYRLRWDELLRDHLEALTSSPAAVVEVELAEFLTRSNGGASAALHSLQRSAPGDVASPFVLPWIQVLKVATRVVLAADKVQKFQRERLNAPTSMPELHEAQLWIEARALRTVELVRGYPTRRSVSWSSFALTAALFAASMALYGSLSFIVQITLVVLVHELGHWFAMRVTGYSHASIFFIPFFGAATAGHKPDASLWQELFVLLAGPLPGILLGALALTAVGPLPPSLHGLAQLAIIVNAANLLPLWPLDGGRIVHRLMLRDRPKLELAMCLASAGVFGIWAYVVFDPVLAILTISLLLSAKSSFRASRCAQRVRELGVAAGTDLLVSALRATADRQAAFAHRVAIVRGVMERLHVSHSSRLQRGLGSACYAGVVAFTLALMGRTLASGEIQEQNLECTDVLAGGERALARVSPRSFGVTCRPSPGQLLGPLLGEVSQLAELPAGLCLQGPWVGAGPAPSEQQLRARRNVRELELAARSIGFDGEELTAREETKLKARTTAAIEAKLKERESLPDCDPAASAAYLNYQRATGKRATERRALEEQLGRAPSCPGDLRIFHADVNERGELRVGSTGDPRPLIQHFCRSGCGSVTWYAAQ
jgi:Zn-dependent protease